jgi:hypothetical protein
MPRRYSHTTGNLPLHRSDSRRSFLALRFSASEPTVSLVILPFGTPTGRLSNIEQPSRHARAYARLLARKARPDMALERDNTAERLKRIDKLMADRSPHLQRNRSPVSNHHPYRSSRCPKAQRWLLVALADGLGEAQPRITSTDDASGGAQRCAPV